MFLILSALSSDLWKILLFFVFLRPFLCEDAFPYPGFMYTFSFLAFSLLYLLLRRKSPFISNPLNVLAFVFWICIFISIIFSGRGNSQMKELFFFSPNLLILYTASAAQQQKKQVVAVMLSSAVMISIFALVQYFWIYDNVIAHMKILNLPVSLLPDYVLQKRVFATFISPNIFATYLGMMVPLGMAILLITYLKKRTMFFSIGMVTVVSLMVVALLLTQSIAGIAALFAGVFIFVFSVLFYVEPYKNIKKSGALKICVYAAAMICFCFLSAAIVSQRGFTRLSNLNDPNNGFVQRLYYWLTSIKIYGDHPLTGIGWRMMGEYYQGYKPAAANISHYSHNVFLQILLETGPLGLIIFLAIIFLFLRNAHRKIKNNQPEQILHIGFLSSASVFLLHNCFDIGFYFGQAAFFWWLILGLC